jgi:hypothetical protein
VEREGQDGEEERLSVLGQPKKLWSLVDPVLGERDYIIIEEVMAGFGEGDAPDRTGMRGNSILLQDKIAGVD